MDKLVVFFLLLSSSSAFAQNDENPCTGDQVQDQSGECVDAVVSRNIYVFAPPEEEDNGTDEEEMSVPKPKLEYNIIFVRAPTAGEGSEPIIVPPPQQKTIVYVLSEKGKAGEQQIIEIPAPPASKPEVYYVNYAEGENPTLPGGVDLQTALESAAETGGEVGPDGSVDPVSPEQTYGAPQAPPAPAAQPPQAPPPQSPRPQAPQAPAGVAPQAPGQAPNIFIVTPQPGVFVSPQGALGSFQPQQGFQQLGFPGFQQFNPALQG